MWRTTINVWREQTFLPGKKVVVEHTYAPITGGSVGNWRHPQSSDANVPDSYWKDFCIDSDFVSGVLRKIEAARRSGAELSTSDSWLTYILRSGANWHGPIKRFTVTIDKGTTDTLVSFCEVGIKKVSPTKFRIEKKDFTPTNDLRVLFVSFYLSSAE